MVTASPTQYWERAWKILVVLDDAKTAIDVSSLRVTGHCTKNIILSQQKAEITIYNLNPETEKILLTKATKVYLEAGYTDGINYGSFYIGDIIQVYRGKENPTDYFVKFICLSEDDYYNWGICGITARRGTNYRELLSVIAKNNQPQLEVDTLPDDWGEQKLSRAFTALTPTKDLLNGIGRSTNSIISIDGGKITVTKLDDTPKVTDAFLINAKTGMIGMPQQTQFGLNIKTLLNPRIKLGNWIKVNNTDVIEYQIDIMELYNVLDRDGLYRIISQTYIFDTRGNDWYIENETITQAGKLPVFLQYPTQNGI